MRPAGRRRPADSLAPDRRPPPPTPTNTADPWQHLSTPLPGRDSDASSRPSLASTGRPSLSVSNVSDRSYQLSALRTINAYLASHSLPSLKHPLPSAKDITETLKFLLQCLGFESKKLDDDLSHALKRLKCPVKLNKSALRAPGTPHSWPNLLAVIHWLVQIIKYNDTTINSSSSFESDKQFMYSLDSYLLYISGDDDALDELDEECLREMREWSDKFRDHVTCLRENEKSLEEKLEGLRAGPTQKEISEKDTEVLEEDVKKFHNMIEQLEGHLVEVKKRLEEKGKALEVKVEDRKRICDENEELKRKIEEQGINLRDAERMKRELQAVDRDIEEMEAVRNASEEELWTLDSKIENKLKEFERFVRDCNQAIKWFKLGNGFQYQLNPKGSTPSEIMGLDYKSLLKPALSSFLDDINKSKMGNFDELISLRQRSSENGVKVEEERRGITVLQSDIDEVEPDLNAIRKETHEYASRCAGEARRLAEEVEVDAQKILQVEKEASELLKVSKAKQQETIAQEEEEVRLCAQELFDLINSVSSYKEYMGSKIAGMRNDLFNTAAAVAEIYKG